jgi:hypothetical protein
MGTDQLGELGQTSGKDVSSDLHPRSDPGPRSLPGFIWHSAATLLLQVADEGHNNKEFAP